MEKSKVKNKSALQIPTQLKKLKIDSLDSFIDSVGILSGGHIAVDHLYLLAADSRADVMPEKAASLKNAVYNKEKTNDHLTFVDKYKPADDTCIWFYGIKNFYYAPVIWFDPSGRGWEAQANIWVNSDGELLSFQFVPWKKVSGLVPVMCPTSRIYHDQVRVHYVLNAPKELKAILLSVNPKAYEFLKTGKIDHMSAFFSVAGLLMAPQIMVLYNCGYAALNRNRVLPLEQADYAAINLLTHSGNSEEEVFPIPLEIRERIKKDPKPKMWMLYALDYLQSK